MFAGRGSQPAAGAHGLSDMFPMERPSHFILKVRLGNDVRRLPCHNADLTFDDLVLMLQRVFADKLPTDDFVLKYQDEDGDLVTIADNQDLHLATMNASVVRLTICTQGGTEIDSSEVDSIHQQLQNVCTAVNVLVRRLDGVASTIKSRKPSTTNSVPGGESKGTSGSSSHLVGLESLALHASHSSSSSTQSTPKTTASKVFQAFDPLKPPASSASAPVVAMPQVGSAPTSIPASSYAGYASTSGSTAGLYYTGSNPGVGGPASSMAPASSYGQAPSLGPGSQYLGMAYGGAPLPGQMGQSQMMPPQGQGPFYSSY